MLLVEPIKNPGYTLRNIYMVSKIIGLVAWPDAH